VTGFKDLLVVVDNSKTCATRLDVAVHVASRFGTHLAGLFVREPPNFPVWAQSEGQVYLRPLSDYAEMHRQAWREAAVGAQHLFRSRADVAGITTEWREREGDVAEMAILHARYADMVIVGQMERELHGVRPARELPERLLLGVGRPILVVPYAGAFRTVGERVLVAWNASREATRAVNDALPILRQASQVTVLAINPRGGVSGDGDVPGADLALHLSHHGVKAEASSLTSEDVAVAPMLLSRVADLQADLLVMGGYGRSRVREIILGGVTREILHSMTVPTLLSH
jgi:nucleotide-binding universal stress UspA family protein